MGIAERIIKEKKIRREQIMAAAEPVFRKKGFTHSTLSEIADKAELSPSTIYLYFKNKEDLFLSLILEMFDHLNHQLDCTYEYSRLLPIEERVEVICASLINTYEKNPKMMTYTVNLQGDEKLEKSDKITSPFTKQLHKTIHAIAGHFNDNVQESTANHKALDIAWLIWSQFTGTVLVKYSLRFMPGNLMGSSLKNLGQRVNKCLDISTDKIIVERKLPLAQKTKCLSIAEI